MQPELVISVAGALLSLAVSVILMLGRANAAAYRTEVDRRFAEQLTKHNDLGSRFGAEIDALQVQSHAQAIESTKRDGELAMLRQELARALEERKVAGEIATLREELRRRYPVPTTPAPPRPPRKDE